MPPVRRLAAGLFVVFLHVLAIWGFVSGFLPKKFPPPPAIVNVSLLPHETVPPLSPPLLPRFSTRPVILPVLPQIMIAPPPRPDTFPPSPQGVFSQQPAAPAAPASPPPIVYLKQLVAYLNGYKNYPYAARIHREQGIVRLHFRMDRKGHVLSYDIAGSSGSAALDNEARAMIQRAQPLPPPPASFPGDILDLIVPVVFSLR